MDELNEFDEDFSQDTTTTQNNEDNTSPYESQEAIEYDDSDLISELLRSKGIQDPSRIKFADEFGNVEEMDWNNLDPQQQLNILDQHTSADEDLDESEVNLLNTIRSSGMTPEEYLQYAQQVGASAYAQQLQSNMQPRYEIDDYSDDELYVADLKSKSEDITDEEAVEALNQAKMNERLFQKQVDAIRNQYKDMENQNRQNMYMQQQAVAQERFDRFASEVENEILNFKDFSGYSLNMDQDDMQELYDFITGTDAAGNSYFQKALNNPELLVRMAWFALNGEQMVRDIDDYYRKELANVSRRSYNQGMNQQFQDVIYKPKGRARSSSYIDDDLD